MATNEHFLLANFVRVISVMGNVARTLDEVVKDVKRERALAKRAVGKRTETLVKKALRKLNHNDLIEFIDVKGQTGYRVTERGISETKRVMRDYRIRPLRTKCSPFQKRAQDNFHLGSFLKKRLVRDTDDLFEEMKNKYQMALEERSGVNGLREEIYPNKPDECPLRTSSSTCRVSPGPDQAVPIPTPPAGVNQPVFDRQNWDDIVSDLDSGLGSMSDSETGTESIQARSARREIRWPSPTFSDALSPRTSTSSKSSSSMRCSVFPEADYDAEARENMFACIDFMDQSVHPAFGGPSRKCSFDSERTLIGSSVEDDVVPSISAPWKQLMSTKHSGPRKRSTSHRSTELKFSHRTRRLHEQRRRPHSHKLEQPERILSSFGIPVGLQHSYEKRVKDMPHSSRPTRHRIRKQAARAEDVPVSENRAQLSDSLHYSSEASRGLWT